MKITQKQPEKTYPYLAICTFGGKLPLVYDENDLVLISLIQQGNAHKMPYVQFVNGNKEGYITKKESDYAPLPTGTIITITQ